MRTVSPYRAKPEKVKPKRTITVAATATVYFTIREEDLEKFTLSEAKKHAVGNHPSHIELWRETITASID